MRVLKTRSFGRFARRESIRDGMLIEAAERVQSGLIDADLGGGLIKQRVARPDKGRRGGYRMLLAFRTGRENIDDGELAKLRVVADAWLAADTAMLTLAVAEGLLIEVDHDS